MVCRGAPSKLLTSCAFLNACALPGLPDRPSGAARSRKSSYLIGEVGDDEIAKGWSGRGRGRERGREEGMGFVALRTANNAPTHPMMRTPPRLCHARNTATRSLRFFALESRNAGAGGVRSSQKSHGSRRQFVDTPAGSANVRSVSSHTHTKNISSSPQHSRALV